jgi:hypothetical protein
MTKEQVEQKIKEILAKDKSFNDAKITINFKDKRDKK